MSEKMYSGETMKGISQDGIDAINDYFSGVHKREPNPEYAEHIQGSDTIFPLTGIDPAQFDSVQEAVAELLTDTEGVDKFTIAVGMAVGETGGDIHALIVSRA